MTRTTAPWTVAAGELIAKLAADAQSSDALTRLSAESMIGPARAELALSIATVRGLEACLALEAA